MNTYEKQSQIYAVIKKVSLSRCTFSKKVFLETFSLLLHDFNVLWPSCSLRSQLAVEMRCSVLSTSYTVFEGQNEFVTNTQVIEFSYLSVEISCLSRVLLIELQKAKISVCTTIPDGREGQTVRKTDGMLGYMAR